MPQSLSRRSAFVALLLFSVLFALPYFARAAEFSFSPASGSYAVGKEFSVKIHVDPGSDSVNAADGTVVYDANILSISSISKDGSAFSLWTAEPSFSNSGGTATFSGGTPAAFNNAGTVLTLVFKAKKAGSAKVSFSNGSILAADGKGTNVYSGGSEAMFTITETAPVAPAPAEDFSADAGGATPLAPVIESPTHPKEDAWYATSTAVFTWKLPSDITGVRMTQSSKSDVTPSETLKAAATTTTIFGIKDGDSYFFLQFQNSAGWSDVAKRKVRIDTVPPKEFDIALVAADAGGGAPKLTFKAEDELSGVDHYDIIFGETLVGSVRAKDLAADGYPIPPQDGGQQSVHVKAYDVAGNVREITRELTLPRVEKPAKAGDPGTVPVQSPWTAERLLTILFAFIIGALTAWIVFIRKSAETNRMVLVRRIAEVGDKNDRVFSAMREEFEQMVNDLDDKPQLTPSEREFLERIKEVLDISEELVDSGVGELKKLARGQ